LDILVPRLLILLQQCNDSSVKIRCLESYNCLLYLLESPNSISVSGLRSRNTSYDSNVDSNNVSSKWMNGNNSTSAGGNGSAAYSLITNIHRFIECLSQLANDSNSTVRKCIMSSYFFARILFSKICEFMLVTLMDPEEQVAMESCEYWNALLQSPETKRAMLPSLSILMDHLITRLYLTSEQMEAERIEEEEEESGERKGKT
jgi:hypothetical protein